MNAEFVGSNILVYAHDPTTPTKHERARSLVERLWSQRTGRISIQVMQEFFWIVTRKIPSHQESKRHPFRARRSLWLLTLLLALIGWLAQSGGSQGDPPDFHSIVVNGRAAAATTTSETENPIISGVVTVPRLTFSRYRPEGLISCCSRIALVADGPYFHNDRTSKLVSVARSNPPARETVSAYTYSSPSLRLPEDGSPVQVSLVVDGETKARTSLRLDDRVIVLPVHLHLYIPPQRGADARTRYASTRKLTEDHIRSWFELNSIRTSSESHRDSATGRTLTSIVTQQFPAIFRSADQLWKQAHIQFRLASYTLVEDASLGRQIISDRERGALLVDPIVETAQGLHIYAGRNEAGRPKAGETSVTRPFCADTTSERVKIALDWQHAVDSPFALAHEIGHFLGLEHVDETTYPECASGLLARPAEATRNLMHSSRPWDQLTSRQIERARSIACRYLQLWGSRPRACA